MFHNHKSPFIACLIAYLFIRFYIWQRPLEWLSQRAEINVPMTSLSEHLETAFLLKRGLPVYSEGRSCQPLPLAALGMEFLHRLGLLKLTFTLIDILAAFVIYEIVRIQKLRWKPPSVQFENTLLPKYVFLIALINPFAIYSSVALNSSSLTRCFVLLSILFAYRGRTAISAFFIAVASYISFYPFLLVIPLSFLTPRRAALPLLSLFWLVTLFRTSRELVKDFSFLNSYLCHLTVPNGKPNLGLAWYLFIEMFDYLRPLFLFVWQCLLILPIPAVCIKFSTRMPEVAIFLTLAIISIHKPYPNTSDYALYLDCLFLLGPIIKYYDRVYVFLFTILSWFICIPMTYLQWRFWMHQGSGNANFYFATGIAWNAILVLWTLHTTWSAIRFQLELDNQQVMTNAHPEHQLLTDE